MIRLICVAIGYLFGLFQTSYIYGRIKGMDIREHGSGNAGATNALRTLGTKAGVITFFGDCFKCVFAVLLVHLLFGRTYPDMIRLLAVYAAAGTILGHNFPCYLKFRGGKGIAATAGLIVSFDWRITIVALVAFVAVFLATHYVSLGSLVVYGVLLVGTLVLGQMGLFAMPAEYLYEMYLLIVLLTILAVWKHRENIKRLLSGTERKTYLSSKGRK